MSHQPSQQGLLLAGGSCTAQHDVGVWQGGCAKLLSCPGKTGSEGKDCKPTLQKTQGDKVRYKEEGLKACHTNWPQAGSCWGVSRRGSMPQFPASNCLLGGSAACADLCLGLGEVRIPPRLPPQAAEEWLGGDIPLPRALTQCQALCLETRAGQSPVTVWRLIRNVSEVTQPLESSLEHPQGKIYCTLFFQLGWSCCKNIFYLSLPFDIWQFDFCLEPGSLEVGKK